MLVGYLLRHLKSSSQANEEKPAKLPCIHQRRQGDQRGRDEGKNVDMLVTVPDEPAAGVALTGMSKQQQSCQECKVEKRTARKYRWKLIGGLIFPFALQALDVTM